MEKRRTPEIIAGRVNADGSIAAGDGFTVQKTGTGAYTITMAPGFRPISGIANAFSASPQALANMFTSGSGYSVQGSVAAATSDIAFSFVAVGVQQ